MLGNQTQAFATGSAPAPDALRRGFLALAVGIVIDQHSKSVNTVEYWEPGEIVFTASGPRWPQQCSAVLDACRCRQNRLDPLTDNQPIGYVFVWPELYD